MLVPNIAMFHEIKKMPLILHAAGLHVSVYYKCVSGIDNTC